MKTRILYPKNIWFNKQLKRLTTTSKLICLYLVSNDNIALTTIYKQQDLELCFLFDLKEEELEKIKIEIEQSGLFYFKNEWVLINNDLSYTDYGGRDRVIDAKNKELDSIPLEISSYFKEVVKGLITGYKPTINYKSKIINNKTRVVKGKFSLLKDITPEIIKGVAEQYSVNIGFVGTQFEKMKNYCESSGRVYKNYLAALRNFVVSEATKNGGKISLTKPEQIIIKNNDNFKPLPNKRLDQIRKETFEKIHKIPTTLP